MGIEWTFITPVAYAIPGEAKPFCPFVVLIGVKPLSLAFDIAVASADMAHKILAGAGFGHAEVALVEGVIEKFGAHGPKLLSFDPLLDNVPELRKVFTPTLGLPIAPLKFPRYTGTGSLFYRFGEDDKRVALLTCAHVARPPPEYPNTGKAITSSSQPRDEIVALGSATYDKAIQTFKKDIRDQGYAIEMGIDVLARLGDPQEGEKEAITERRTQVESLVDQAKRRIVHVSDLLKEAQDRADPNKRKIGCVLHSEIIGASAAPNSFTQDWALIEIHDDMTDWGAFRGNKVYVAERSPPTVTQYKAAMWPQPADLAEYRYPLDGLLQVDGIMQEEDLRNPQNLDIHNQKCLLVVKNGAATGTTYGRANGLESFIRHYPPYGAGETSTEFAVFRYSEEHPRFSEPGDSGSPVLDRTGKIVGILTGGGGLDNNTNISYITPYWETDKHVKDKFEGIQLYPVVD